MADHKSSSKLKLHQRSKTNATFSFAIEGTNNIIDARILLRFLNLFNALFGSYMLRKKYLRDGQEKEKCMAMSKVIISINRKMLLMI